MIRTINRHGTDDLSPTSARAIAIRANRALWGDRATAKWIRWAVGIENSHPAVEAADVWYLWEARSENRGCVHGIGAEGCPTTYILLIPAGEEPGWAGQSLQWELVGVAKCHPADWLSRASSRSQCGNDPMAAIHNRAIANLDTWWDDIGAFDPDEDLDPRPPAPYWVWTS